MDSKLNRRSFIKRMLYLLGIIFSIEIIYTLSKTLFVKKNSSEETVDDYYEVGSVNDFEINKVYPFKSRHFFLIKKSSEEFYALSSKCSHLGCVLNYDEQKNVLACPCHSSSFDISGSVLKPPATKSLDKLKVKIVLAKVRVYKNNIS